MGITPFLHKNSSAAYFLQNLSIDGQDPNYRAHMVYITNNSEVKQVLVKYIHYLSRAALLFSTNSVDEESSLPTLTLVMPLKKMASYCFYFIIKKSLT